MTSTILITGCSSGIGLDAARTLAARGWRVFATCRKAEDTARLQAEGLESLVLDYADPDSVASAVAKVAARTSGRLDALFNNGAFAIPGPLEDLTREAMEAQFHANFLGWHDLTVRAIPLMRANGGGRIVNCSSVLGLVSAHWRGAYCATKFAVEGWSDALRMEMADANIHVSLIEPGPIATRFRANAVAAFERWVDWENSVRADQYRSELLSKLHEGSGASPFRLPPSAVTAKLIHALESPRPRPRYYVTKPTYIADILRRTLPTRLLDRVISRA
jgi:NAD(P)-dependent dehydrogenase (short-subunit alcohol dehydrogenase family)